ncbi:type VII secretion-associated serine protease mycosin [Plantactinospora sp. BC1]|uniref:type VII secretion-associated serine protease mycosin n=1 Tax=Plantactinospora sp. BC1 TaxID=2108470 RepID=UPI001F306545|nr:type VII secretion-associated serine protease mycosin [Plantactinospora sp. BC1]
MALLCATAVAVLPAAPARADQVRNNQWHLKYLKIADAHEISQGERVTIAVIDTGVDPHPDLRNNLLSGTVAYSGGTGDGREDGDPGGHGTSMAGLIAAHGRGPNGVLGVAPKAKIIPIRDSKSKSGGDPDDTAKAIEWAISKKVDVINISAVMSSSSRLREAIEAALQADIVVVASAGNRPGHILVGFPAAFEGVVAVGATDRKGNYSTTSVTGKKVVLAAPGIDIHSTAKGGRYSKTSGTSDSAAIVSGAAALVRSKFPDLSAEEVVHRLTATADDKGTPGRDEEYGYGVLNLVKALTADVPPLEGSANPSASAAPSPTQTQPADNAAPEPENKSNAGSTILIGVLIALVVLGLLVTLLVVLLLRRRQPRL